MTLVDNFDAVSICFLSLKQNMNLRKSRFSSKQIKSSPCKDIKSSYKVKKSSRYVEKGNFLSGSLPGIPVKSQKPVLVLDDILMVKNRFRPSQVNLVTSTPIPSSAKKRFSTLSNIHNIFQISNVNSLNRMPSAITSTPIQKIVHQKLGKFSIEKKSNKILRSDKKSTVNQQSQNSPVKNLKKSVRSTRTSMSLRSQNASMQNNINIPLTRKSKSSRKTSITAQKQTKSQTSLGKCMSENEVQSEGKKHVKHSSICSEKLTFSKDLSLSHEYSFSKSSHETDNSKTRYSLRNSTVPQSKSSKNFRDEKDSSSCGEKMTSHFLLMEQNNSALDKSNVLSGRKRNLHNIVASGHLQKSLSKSKNEIDTFRSSRCSSRLQNQQISKQASGNRSCSKRILVDNQNVTNTPKNLLKPSYETETSRSSRCNSRLQNQQISKKASGNRSCSRSSLIDNQNVTKSLKSWLEPSSTNAKRSSRCSLRLQENQSSKKKTVNKSLIHSPKKTATKRQKLVKNISKSKSPKELEVSCKKYSKKQKSSKKSVSKSQNKTSSLTDIPLDDLALHVRSSDVKLSGKNTLKRKRCVIQAMMDADEGYEDDLYASKRFDEFQDIFLPETSDSEMSFAMSTPKFPVTPHFRHNKTPILKDYYNRIDYELKRKVAIENYHRNKNRKSSQKISETPVLTERRKLEYSQILENAEKVKKTIENLGVEESEDDSYITY